MVIRGRRVPDPFSAQLGALSVQDWAGRCRDVPSAEMNPTVVAEAPDATMIWTISGVKNTSPMTPKLEANWNSARTRVLLRRWSASPV